jgi:two-component system response regulator FixJ
MSSRPSIAVIDDEASVRIALGRLLCLAHYDVKAFASGEEFIESLATRRPACALLDIHMPAMSGFDVQARLSAMRIEVPVVFITARDDASLSEKVVAAGGIRLLRKPFSNAELLEAIELALRGRPVSES